MLLKIKNNPKQNENNVKWRVSTTDFFFFFTQILYSIHLAGSGAQVGVARPLRDGAARESHVPAGQEQPVSSSVLALLHMPESLEILNI